MSLASLGWGVTGASGTVASLYHASSDWKRHHCLTFGRAMVSVQVMVTATGVGRFVSVPSILGCRWSAEQDRLGSIVRTGPCR